MLRFSNDFLDDFYTNGYKPRIAELTAESISGINKYFRIGLDQVRRRSMSKFQNDNIPLCGNYIFLFESNVKKKIRNNASEDWL